MKRPPSRTRSSSDETWSTDLATVPLEFGGELDVDAPDHWPKAHRPPLPPHKKQPCDCSACEDWRQKENS